MCFYKPYKVIELGMIVASFSHLFLTIVLFQFEDPNPVTNPFITMVIFNDPHGNIELKLLKV